MAQMPASNILAKSTFSQPSTTDMATTDVYTTSNPGVVNSVQDSEDKETSSAKSLAVRGSKYLKSVMPAVQTILSDGTALANATSGKQRLALLMSGTSSLFSKLPDDYKSLITNDPATFGTSIVKIGSVTSKVLNTNFSNVSSTAGLIGAVSGDASLVGVQDNDSALSLTSALATEASRTRIPNSYTSLIGTLSSSTLVNKFAGMTLPATLAYSDSLGLKDLATSSKPGDVNLLNPNIVDDFTTQYTAPPECTAAQYGTEYSNVMSSFSSVNSSWNTTTRSGDSTTSVNLTQLTNSSDDMQTVLKTGYMDSTDPTVQMYSLSTLFPSTSVSDSMANQYPNTVFSN